MTDYRYTREPRETEPGEHSTVEILFGEGFCCRYCSERGWLLKVSHWEDLRHDDDGSIVGASRAGATAECPRCGGDIPPRDFRTVRTHSLNVLYKET